MDLEKILST